MPGKPDLTAKQCFIHPFYHFDENYFKVKKKMKGRNNEFSPLAFTHSVFTLQVKKMKRKKKEWNNIYRIFN